VPGALSTRLAELSAAEIADALGVRARIPRAFLIAAARVPSARLGRVLARFDALVATDGLARAARTTLEELGASIDVDGMPPARGGALVVTNHPGAYDALALMAALGRDDVAFLAADRAFLRAMPNVASHLVLVDERSAVARAAGIRRALEWMKHGHVLVQYGAGAIEPDARFDEGEALAEWREGTGALAARAPCVVPAFVSGVHSPRAKRLAIVRWAERRGVTTIAPLVQAALPGFRDVVVTVRFGEPIHERQTTVIREAVARLRGTSRRIAPTSAASAHTRVHSSRARDAAPSSG
jgi:1-acyl-sn-glycerol-3-phosphate acyltransferase